MHDSKFTNMLGNFHPYCPVSSMNNGPSELLECRCAFERPAAKQKLNQWHCLSTFFYPVAGNDSLSVKVSLESSLQFGLNGQSYF